VSTLVVVSNRPWYGPANQGNGWVIVDGEKVGVLEPSSIFTTSLSAGEHSVRIRQLWYSSPAEVFHFGDDSQVVLRAEFAKRGFNRFVTGLFRPARFFRLSQTDAIVAPKGPGVDPRPYQLLTAACAVTVIAGVIVARSSPNAVWSGIVGISSIAIGVVGSLVASLLLRKKIRESNARPK
jgi:hypothetical protein